MSNGTPGNRIVPLTSAPPAAPPSSEAPTEVLRATPDVPRAAPPPRRPAESVAEAGGEDAADPKSAPNRRNGLGLPALALGLLAAGTAWNGWAGVVLGMFAVAAGFLGARRGFHGEATDGGAALGGLVLGAVGLVWGGVVVAQGLFGGGAFGDGLTLDQCMAQSTSARDQHMCKSQHITEFNQRFPNAAE